MKKIILFICILTFDVSAQNISRAEYFIDSDPGYGNGIPIALIIGPDITVDFSVDLNILNDGFHILYIRAKDDSGIWSITHSKPFYKQSLVTIPPIITHMEYFIDTDPGIGNATNLSLISSQDITMDFSVDLSGIPDGFHLLYIRGKDSEGKWSIVGSKAFYKEVQAPIANITEIEYFFSNNETISPVYNYYGFIPSSDVDISFAADISSLTGYANFYFHLYGKDSRGLTSVEYTHEFFVEIPDIQFSSDILSFPDIPVGSNYDLPVTIYNKDTSDLSISSTTIAGTNAEDFSIFQGSGASTVVPGDSQQVVIRFSPITVGSKTALFIVQSNADTSPDTVQLIGNNTTTVQVDSLPANNLDIGIQIIPPVGYVPQSYTLYYRRGGEKDWQSTDLIPLGNNFTVNIPASYSTFRGVEYYIYLNDGLDVITYPPIEPQSHPAIIQVHINEMTAQTNFEARKHKMVSIPLELADTGIDSIFFDDYGNYNKLNWRLQYWDGQQQEYVEYPELNAGFEPGFSCWLITKSGLPFDVENGKSMSSDSACTIALQPGWNQISTPFAFPVAWDSIGNASMVNQPVYWNGQDYEYGISRLTPWEGYFVYNLQATTVSLDIQPDEATSGLGKKSSFGTLAENEFIIQISADDIQSGQSDTQNFMGMLANSKNNLDARDYLQAPPILKKMELSVVDNDTLYAGNFKSISSEGAYWDLQIAPFNKSSKVRLDLVPLKDLPELFAMYLLDLDYKCTIDIKENKKPIEFSNTKKRNLRLIVGKESFANSHNNEIPLIPLKFRLDQNFPNPFNPTTSISYTLAKDVYVKMEIYNILGQKVITLVKTFQKGGLHQVMWNGQNASDNAAASGVYVCRLQADNFIGFSKMVLIR